ncbi:hypothetical protein EXIGLDRAFT_696593 [Exidia glandulosa HHB12029]|uniref:Uncharacterized protein n=1 Tax=Exidia glandulosa HHB12029 TaxID=1314781 RepID=A0A166A569_EXIGL|nr:hypothetical protein EXIGLDRAFT_696593 [Exidia glandulosa HHB12029]
MALCSGFYSLSIFIACRAAFWEITAHRVFRRHDTGRWILLAFDLLIILVVLGFFLETVVQSILTYRRYSDAYIGYHLLTLFLLRRMDNILTTFVWVTQSLLAAGYINGAVGTYFARRWARQYQFGVSVADTMFKCVAPAFVVQVLLVIPCTFGFFWASILWRIQQIVVLAEDDFPVLPPSMQLWWPSADVQVEKQASGSDDSVTTLPMVALSGVYWWLHVAPICAGRSTTATLLAVCRAPSTLPSPRALNLSAIHASSNTCRVETRL